MATRMAPADAVWFLGENDVNPMTISSILWFDRPLDTPLLTARVVDRLLERHPILTERVVPSRIPGRMPRWVDDPRFDPAEHLTEHVLPAPGDQAALQAWCSRERTTPLDRTRPLWHLSILQGYRGGGSAVHVRIHHSIGDGLALLQLLLSVTDEFEPGDTLIGERSLAARVSGVLGAGPALLAFGSDLALHPSRVGEVTRNGLHAVGWTGRLLAPQMVERTILQGTPEGTKRMAWDPDGFPLAEVKATARGIGATVNDVLLTVLGGALHRYLAARDALVEDVAVMIPINLRPPGEPLPRRLGNRIGLLPLRVPVRSPDPLVRLAVLRERMDELKRSPAPALSRSLIVATTLLTPVVERGVHRLNQLRSTGVVTNVAGPVAPLHIGGARLLGTMGWGGLTAHLNLSAAFVSVGERIMAGLVTDAAITPDPECILAELAAEYPTTIGALSGAPAAPSHPAGPDVAAGERG